MSAFAKLTAVFSAFAAIILAFHVSYVFLVTPHEEQNFKFVAGYVFLYILTLGLFAMVTWMHSQDEKKMGMAFLIGSSLKMLLSLLFILMLVYNNVPGYYALTIQFLIPYMLFLIFEVVYMLRLLKAP